MTLEISDQYYLKALDWYGSDLETSVEALNYALSYDPEHAPSHCLMGKISGHKLKDPKRAFHHMELALLYDQHYLEAYYSYLYLLIQYGQMKRADRILQRSMQINGVDEPSILMLSAQSHERKGNYYIAKITLQHAHMKSDCSDQLSYIETAIQRLDTKLKQEKESG